VQDASGAAEINSLHFTQAIDIVGAGDAFLAGFATARGAGMALREAALVGTFASGVSLGKIFTTGHPTTAEVLALAEDADFNYQPRLARDPTMAQWVQRSAVGAAIGAEESPNTEIEIITERPARRGFPEVAIFDHDGTISVLRHGWESVMRGVMTDAIAGRITHAAAGATGATGAAASSTPLLPVAELERIQHSVNTLIEKTTGVQTLAQMYQLRDLVVEFGHTAEVLTPAEYKAIYNRALLATMEKRLRGLQTGRLAATDLTIKGAVDFLQKLAGAGTKLYLASGTDQDDARREARLLGYADLFTGGIFGSVGDIKNDPKKIVIRNIIAEIKKRGGSCERGNVAVFGDGPVEMREAKKAGLFAIGILSDEDRRYGANPAKRERLILAGADLLIPDFSWAGELSRFCGWE
jgi:phosphoglycolate phosphatase-like HAD superfamily hydrolase